MNLKEIKENLNKFSSEFDDVEVAIHTVLPSGEDNFEILSFISYIPSVKGVVIGSDKSAESMIRKCNVKFLKKDERP